MTVQYSFLSTCQQIANDELSAERNIAGETAQSPPPVPIGHHEHRVTKREKILSLIGGLLPSKSQADQESKESIHEKPGLNSTTSIAFISFS
jgi:hypothetical protein